MVVHGLGVSEMYQPSERMIHSKSAGFVVTLIFVIFLILLFTLENPGRWYSNVLEKFLLTERKHYPLCFL